MQLLLKSLPIICTASLSSVYVHNKYSKPAAASAVDVNGLFETPEQYFKPMFTMNDNASDVIEPKQNKLLMTSEEIIDRLSENANKVECSNDKIVSHYYSNQYAANNPIEDTFDVRKAMKHYPQLNGMLFGVFDGHSGYECSHFVRKELFDFIEYCSMNKESVKDQEKPNDEIECLSPDHLNEYLWYKQHKLLPFTRSFLLADTCFLLSCNEENKTQKNGNQGSCGIVCYLDDEHKWITTSWVGDCRAIIGQKDPDTGEWKCVELTRDHQINLNPKEKLRLLTEHPNESDVIKRNRVKGRLQPTRVFGDGHYKYMKFFKSWKRSEYYVNGSWTPPYVTAKPDISCYKMDLNRDVFMIISSDGLFQDLENQEIVQYVGRILDKNDGKNGNKCNISTLLIKEALLASSHYVNGRMENEEGNVSAVINLHPKVKRNVHDDLTVISLFFNQDYHEMHQANSKNSNLDKQQILVPESLQNVLHKKPVASKL